MAPMTPLRRLFALLMVALYRKVSNRLEEEGLPPPPRIFLVWEGREGWIGDPGPPLSQWRGVPRPPLLAVQPAVSQRCLRTAVFHLLSNATCPFPSQDRPAALVPSEHRRHSLPVPIEVTRMALFPGPGVPFYLGQTSFPDCIFQIF